MALEGGARAGVGQRVALVPALPNLGMIGGERQGSARYIDSEGSGRLRSSRRLTARQQAAATATMVPPSSMTLAERSGARPTAAGFAAYGPRIYTAP